jgi:hypothetical protein
MQQVFTPKKNPTHITNTLYCHVLKYISVKYFASSCVKYINTGILYKNICTDTFITHIY